MHGESRTNVAPCFWHVIVDSVIHVTLAVDIVLVVTIVLIPL